ncbi:hypothetical protein DSO57_1025317 [Entomophthora muscae]|uniref:Uncharacterized protein n=1 Tax=Entomophthora muscae TaxID=34485 RepID=A0ACC2RT92_9FUNG|nr:hypothetical protein DSO57_1025317 [Entomophthora muscae]
MQFITDNLFNCLVYRLKDQENGDKVESLAHANKAIIKFSKELKVPENTPEALLIALNDSTFFAQQCLDTVAELTTKYISSCSTNPHQRSTIALTNAQKDAEEALSSLAHTLYTYDSLTNGSSIMSLLMPHLSDQPTPWLSAFEHLSVENSFEPNPPPEELSLMD